MEKRTKVLIAKILIILTAGFFSLVLLNLFFSQKAYADSFVVDSQLREPPNFDEFCRWFGPAPKGNERTKQLFDATKLLINEMDKNPRDSEAAAETIRCKFTPDQWQDVIGVAIAYKIWQGNYLIWSELGKMKPGVSKAELASELMSLESSLKAEIKKILDGQAKTDGLLQMLQLNVEGLAKKIDSQSQLLQDLLARIKDQINLLDDISARTQRIEEVVNDSNEILKGIDQKVDKILREEKEEPEEHVCLASEPEPFWPEEKKPKSFWAGFGALGGEKVYTNPLGVMADFAVFHTRPGLFLYAEVGARKFLIKDFLAIQAFGAYGSAWFAGVGLVGNIKFLDLSVSAGAQFLPDYLVGDLGPVQAYAELTHEGRWTRMSLRVVPNLNLAQFSVSAKF